MNRWIVLLDASQGHHAYGPIEDRGMANGFAAFLSREVDPAKVLSLIDPMDELIAFVQRNHAEKAVRPIMWPPQPGQVWQDRNGDRWACVRAPAPYLMCLARPADDGADEIWSHFGPMTFVQFVSPNEEEEPPF